MLPKPSSLMVLTLCLFNNKSYHKKKSRSDYFGAAFLLIDALKSTPHKNQSTRQNSYRSSRQPCRCKLRRGC